MTIKQLGEILIFVVGFIGGLVSLAKYGKAILKQLLADEFKPIHEKLETIDKKVDENEADRIRAEIEMYYHRCMTLGRIDELEKVHLDKIYRKYHEILKQNGEITHEYEYIVKYYEDHNKKD